MSPSGNAPVQETVNYFYMLLYGYTVHDYMHGSPPRPEFLGSLLYIL